MRTLSVLGRDRRAVSVIVSYVLLITITLTLSVLVYNWLRFYVSDEEVPVCSDNVNIIIKDYDCFPSEYDMDDDDWTFGNLQITLKNKGLFGISGFILRVNDREDAEFGIYTFNESGVALAPGEEVYKKYDFGEILEDDYELKEITIVEVQPFVVEDGKIICKSYSRQKIDC